MSNEHIRPSSIDGIKQLAKRLKKSGGIKYALALEQAARAAGFENFKHAQRQLGGGVALTTPTVDLYISVVWREAATKVVGCEILKMRLAKPLDELLKPPQYTASRDLRTMRREAHDHLGDTYARGSQEAAREAACRVARTIQFIEATRLVPSKARRSFPRGQFQNRMPGSDHDLAWFDPESKTFLRTSEPYAVNEVTAKQTEWAARHGWVVMAAPWKGMYRPDGGSSLFLLADTAKGYSLTPLMERLANASNPIVTSAWDGRSLPPGVAFLSPGQTAELKARELNVAVRQPVNRNSVEYTAPFSGARHRPTSRMPIDGHKLVGRLLKSALIGTRERAGIYRRVDAIRCELDNWVQCEYARTELSDETFFELYYHDLPESDPLGRMPTTWDRHISSLAEVKATLARHYPECRPLNDLLKKADQAIASLLSWKVSPPEVRTFRSRFI